MQPILSPLTSLLSHVLWPAFLCCARRRSVLSIVIFFMWGGIETRPQIRESSLPSHVVECRQGLLLHVIRRMQYPARGWE